MSRRTRVGIVGAGYWGQAHVRTFAAQPGCELTWVCDRSPEALGRVRRIAPSARLTERWNDLLSAADVDAIVIATPAAQHGEMAQEALASGRHVLVEKPMALRVDDAEAVVTAAARSGATFAVGHLMLYHPVVARLRGLVDDGELGDLFYLSSTRVNLGRIRSDENALWSLGPHDLSIFDHLLRLPLSRVVAHGGSHLQEGIADVVFATLSFARLDGPPILAHVHLSWLNPRKERRMVVVGSAKMVEFDDMARDKLLVHDRGYERPPTFASFADYLILRDGPVTIPHVPMGEPLAIMVRHFLACIEARRSPLTDAASGLRVVRMLAATQAALERGQR